MPDQESDQEYLVYSGEPVEGLTILGVMNPTTTEIDINESFDSKVQSFASRAESLTSAVPRPDLNGVRLKAPNNSAIYVVIDGYRRWIPDPGTYNNLFRNWDGILVVTNIPDIAVAEPLSSGAVLARATGSDPIYLISNGVKRHITSPSVMGKYNFDMNKVQNLPVTAINSISTGSRIQ
jgi:hypothetical protein